MCAKVLATVSLMIQSHFEEKKKRRRGREEERTLNVLVCFKVLFVVLGFRLLGHFLVGETLIAFHLVQPRLHLFGLCTAPGSKTFPAGEGQNLPDFNFHLLLSTASWRAGEGLVNDPDVAIDGVEVPFHYLSLERREGLEMKKIPFAFY